MHKSQIRKVLRATVVLWHDMVCMESLSIFQVLVTDGGTHNFSAKTIANVVYLCQWRRLTESPRTTPPQRGRGS
jgi:hypothetical protein